jgi:hypothetical protein
LASGPIGYCPVIGIGRKRYVRRTPRQSRFLYLERSDRSRSEKVSGIGNVFGKIIILGRPVTRRRRRTIRTGLLLEESVGSVHVVRESGGKRISGVVQKEEQVGRHETGIGSRIEPVSVGTAPIAGIDIRERPEPADRLAGKRSRGRIDSERRFPDDSDRVRLRNAGGIGQALLRLQDGCYGFFTQ